jgi:hypothetical protein
MRSVAERRPSSSGAEECGDGSTQWTWSPRPCAFRDPLSTRSSI